MTQTPDYVSTFMDVVYPEMTALLTTVKTEKDCLIEATSLISGYRSALKAIAGITTNKETNHAELSALCIAIAKSELDKATQA